MRMAWAHGKDLPPRGATSGCLTPGWLRSEMMLETFGVTESPDAWRYLREVVDAGKPADAVVIANRGAKTALSRSGKRYRVYARCSWKRSVTV
jgi:hypothetical protein